MNYPTPYVKLILSLLVALLSYLSLIYKKPQCEPCESVLSALLKQERSVSIATDLTVAVGFGSCLDFIVPGLPFMEMLGMEPPKTSKYHDSLKTVNDVTELFTFVMAEGVAAERFVPISLLDKLLDVAENVKGTRFGAGGNAPLIARHFAKEGFKNVFVGAQLSDRFNKLFPSNMTYVGDWMGEDDIHLVLEYTVGEKWGNFTAKRANRFILHSDQSNPFLQSLEKFEKKVHEVNPRLVVIGGLQMLDNFPFRNGDREYRMEALSEVLKNIPSTTLIHFEMASFSEQAMLQSIMEIVFPIADSLGLTEQELANVISMIRNGSILHIADEHPRVATVLDNMRALYNRYDNVAGKLTRLHVHTHAFQAILVGHHSDWRHTSAATAKASLTAHRHVCGDDGIDTKKTALIMDESFQVSLSSEETVLFNQSAPVSCWNEEKFALCVAPVLVCTEVKQTVGLRDSVTAAALMSQISS